MTISFISQSVWGIGALLIGIIAINFIIAFHELGHWLFCKLFNIRTPSFSVGFGPRLWSKKLGSTLFAFSAIPFGGYVEIAGAEEVGQGDQLDAKATDEESITNKPYWQKICVLLGGILFNIILSFTIFVGLWLFGMPKTDFFYSLTSPTIESVKKDSPAEIHGLVGGQKIIAFEAAPLTTTKELIELIRTHKGKSVALKVLSQTERCSLAGICEKIEEEKTVHVAIGEHPENSSWGYLGAVYQLPESLKANSFGDALSKSYSMTKALFLGTIKGLAYSFSKKTTAGLGGPLRLFSDATEQIFKGFGYLLLLMANISLGLAVINLMPLPVFDGGQVITYTIEALVGRELPEKIKYIIHLGTAVTLVGFLLYLSFKDSLHIWEKIKAFIA